jgi:hypothetical protein
MQILWSGNVTFNIEGSEATYVLDTINIEQQGKDMFSIKITTREDEAEIIIPLSKQDCKRLISELVQNL